MLKLIYSDNGNVIPDSRVLGYVDGIIKDVHKAKGDITFRTGSELMVMAFFLRYLEGELKENEVEFYINNEKLSFFDISKVPSVYEDILDATEEAISRRG